MLFRFGDSELDSARYELRRNGLPVPIEPKALDVLFHLVRERHRLVTKQELLEAVWPGVHVTESTLTRAVSLARTAIGDRGRSGAVIETVSGRGYRWMAPVEVVESSDAPRRTNRRARRLAVSLAAGAAAAVLLVALVWPRPIGWMLALTGSARPPLQPNLPAEPSLIVLPFVDLSPNGGFDHLAEGLAEDLTSGLVRFSELFVISRGSALTYRDRSTPLGHIGRELGVRYVVEGSVRVAGERAVVNAHLVEARSGRELWADRVDTRLQDVMDVRGRLGESIVEKLGVRIREAELDRLRGRHPNDYSSYELFLRGRAHFYAFTRQDHARARELFRQALVRNPDYELPLAFLSALELAAYVLGWDVRSERIEAALELANRAHRLDPFEPMPHTVRAMAYALQSKDAKAAVEARRAVELGPNSDFCYGVKAVVHAHEGRVFEAIRALDRALRLNPRHPEFYWMLAGHLHARTGRPDLALELFERVRDANPDTIPPRLALVLLHAGRGELERARGLAAEILAINPGLTGDLALRLYAPARSDPELAERARAAWRAAGLP